MKYQFPTQKKIKKCLDCPCLKLGIYGGMYCKVEARQLETDKTKPYWCPLVEVESEGEG